MLSETRLLSMAYVAILMSNPAKPAVDATIVARIASILPNAAPPRLLAPGIAADISFTGTSKTAPDILDIIRKNTAGMLIDVAVLPVAHRRKRLLLADMDSTMIQQECIDELAAFVGLKDKVSQITARAMRGEIAFEPALRERVALLKGLPVSVIDEIVAGHKFCTSKVACKRTLAIVLKSHSGINDGDSGSVAFGDLPGFLGFDHGKVPLLVITRVVGFPFPAFRLVFSGFRVSGSA